MCKRVRRRADGQWYGLSSQAAGGRPGRPLRSTMTIELLAGHRKARSHLVPRQTCATKDRTETRQGKEWSRKRIYILDRRIEIHICLLFLLIQSREHYQQQVRNAKTPKQTARRWRGIPCRIPAHSSRFFFPFQKTLGLPSSLSKPTRRKRLADSSSTAP